MKFIKKRGYHITIMYTLSQIETIVLIIFSKKDRKTDALNNFCTCNKK